MPLSFDLFCRVIDNYGDIGVCWRLARRLASRPDTGPIRLWVDDLAAFAHIAPSVQTDALVQAVEGIEIRHWVDRVAADVEPADVIVEAFACTLPPEYVARITHRHLWINLEYLSAEEWVESCHGRPSLQAGGQRKFFFFPGFTAATGGLLREPELGAQRDAWQADPEARMGLLSRLGVSPSWLERLRAGARLVYVFCYPEAPLSALIAALSLDGRDTLVLMPEGVAPPTLPQALARALPRALPHASPSTLPAVEARPGRVGVHTHAFVDQPIFDRVLWSADLNLVRGEDSLVRAIWAGRPMIWQAYRQEEGTHLDKLDAWLARAPYGPEFCALNRAWNEGDDKSVIEQLPRLLNAPQWCVWQEQALAWRAALESRNDLADNLMSFCTEQAQTR